MYDRSFPAVGKTPEGVAFSKTAQGLFLERLVLTEFRNYAQVTLSLPEKTPQVVLTGPNGAGKTNLLEAVSLLTAGKGLRQARLGDLARKGDIVNAQWAVAARVRRAFDALEIGTGRAADGTEKRTLRVNGENASQTALARQMPMVWLTPAMDRLFSGDPAGRRRFLDRLAQCFDDKHAGHCIAYARAFKQWRRLVDDGVKDESWFSALETSMASCGEKIDKARRRTIDILNGFLNVDDGVFPRTVLSLDNVPTEQLASLFKAARRAQTAPAGIHQTALNALNVDKNMPAALCSTGEQKAMLIAVLTAHLKAQADKTGTLPLLLLDEAAAHLDSRRLEAFTDSLTRLKTQVWLTGTNPEAFTALKRTAYFCAVPVLIDGRRDLDAAAS